jgi:hypothetical protein
MPSGKSAPLAAFFSAWIAAFALCSGAAHAATLNGSATLDSSSPTFIRPNAACGQGNNSFKFVAVDFVVDTATTYSIGAPANAQVTDPWLQLYNSPFTASLPLVNCIIGDDDSGGGLNALIANQALTPGQVYTALITTYNPSQVGTVNWQISGAGNLLRRNGFVKAEGAQDFANGTVGLALRLSSNGADTNDDLKWVAVAPGSAVPTHAEVIAGQQSGGSAAPHAGTLANQALDVDITPTISGLTNGTWYDLYITLQNSSQLGTVRALDFIPDVPVFAAVNNAALSTPTSSAPVALTGFTEALPISISAGGEYKVNNGAFTSTAGTARPGDAITLRQTSSSLGATGTTVTLTLGPVTSSFVVTTVAPVAGVCGTAANTATAFAPAANRCAIGTPSSVTGGANWSWSCTGTGGGATASCSAPLEATPTGTGTGHAAVSGGTWVVNQASSAGFIAASNDPSGKSPGSLPPGIVFPHGLFDFVLTSGAAGSAATITITYPQPLPAGTTYWKYGPSPNGFNCSGGTCATPHWYQMPPSQAVISGNTITLTIIDGGVGDSDLTANSVITDPGGPGFVDPDAVGIPTLSEWGMLMLSGMLAIFGLARLRRQQRAGT